MNSQGAKFAKEGILIILLLVSDTRLPGDLMVMPPVFVKLVTGLLPLFLLCCLTPSVAAQQDVDPVVVLPDWEVGQKLLYELVKTRKKSEDQRVTLDTTAKTIIEIEVLGANERGYTLAWTFGETRFDDPDLQQNPVVKQMGNLLKGYRIVLDLDQNVVIKGVKNWKDVRDSTGTIIEVLTKSLRVEGIDETVIKSLRQQVESIFSTEQQIIQLCTREAQLFLWRLQSSSFHLSP